MLSRAWYLIAGIAVAVALAGVGYYTGRARTLDRWALERAALGDSVDSARARSGRIGAELDRMTGELDSAIAQWVADSTVAQDSIKQLAARGGDPARTIAAPPGRAVPLPRSDTGAGVSGYAACSAVVAAARAYQSACQATRDSLESVIDRLAARKPDTVMVTRGAGHASLRLSGGYEPFTRDVVAGAGVEIAVTPQWTASAMLTRRLATADTARFTVMLSRTWRIW